MLMNIDEISIELTDSEMLSLDGKCRQKTQFAVDYVKERMVIKARVQSGDEKIDAFVATVVMLAKRNGKLGCRRVSMEHCPLCGKRADYPRYKRDSPLHAKGEKNTNAKPMYFSGIDLTGDFVVTEHYARVGCCFACLEKTRSFLVKELDIVEAEVPKEVTGHPPRFKFYHAMKCLSCGWEGHEGQMRMVPSIMGNPYRAGCPVCDKRNSMAGLFIKQQKGHVVVPLDG